MYSRSIVIIVTLVLLPEMTFAWGNRESHPRLVDHGRDRTQRDGASIEAYLQDELGLAAGLDEPLAIQLGFGKPEIEADLVGSEGDADVWVDEEAVARMSTRESPVASERRQLGSVPR